MPSLPSLQKTSLDLPAKMPAVLVQPTRLASTNEVFNEHKDQIDNAYSRRIKQMMHPTLQAALDILQTPHTAMQKKWREYSCCIKGLEGQIGLGA